MRFITLAIFYSLLFLSSLVNANPYWNPQRVPTEQNYGNVFLSTPNINSLKVVDSRSAIDVLRIQVDWQENSEFFTVNKIIIEPSGTPALLARSTHKPVWGSYLGVLKDNTGQVVYYDAIGTGKEYRKLARAINLRFPVPKQDMRFELFAENPNTGVMEKVVSKDFSITQIIKQQPVDNVEIKELALATRFPAVRVNIYAEGYSKNEQQIFWQHAIKTVQVLQKEKFPGVEYMSFYGVFHTSNQKLGMARDLGNPVPEYDSFLGLYYPYWDSFGRWHHVVYPTRENKFRQALAVAPYDYPIILVNDSGYWGVGNYMSHTAIPAANTLNFTYLLLHEFGHFFGLNEEYRGGGRTELEFAPDMLEPWSQNISFLLDNRYESLKWKTLVAKNIPLPTSDSLWKSSPPVYGAYSGGYADSPSTRGRSHRPGRDCVMEDKRHFCQICNHAIEEVVQYSSGVKMKQAL